jgi:D-alanyl-D-alanine carboxypeptidase (penicillin-binding protein 5/6)
MEEAAEADAVSEPAAAPAASVAPGAPAGPVADGGEDAGEGAGDEHTRVLRIGALSEAGAPEAEAGADDASGDASDPGAPGDAPDAAEDAGVERSDGTGSSGGTGSDGGTGQDGARPADDVSAAEPSDAVPGDAEAAVDDAIGGPDAEPADRTDAGPDAEPADRTETEPAGRAETEPAGRTDDEPSDAVAKGAEEQSGGAPEDARPEDLRKGAGAGSTSVLRPLVSDLPAERPAGGARNGSSGARNAPSPASAPYEAPQAPPASAKPRTGPAAPSGGPAEGPVDPSTGSGKPAAGAPLPPYAGRPSAIGTPTAGAPDGAAAGPEGTRPMPVPPEPEAPLKLLAELTNTPPPRPTLLRAITRRFKIWTPLVLLLAIVFVVVQALRPLPTPSMALTAAPSYTFDGTPLPQTMPWPAQGQSVAEVEGLGSLGVHGAQTPVPIASVTKVMTAYLILRDHPLSGKQTGPSIPVDAQAASEAGSNDESTAKVKEGQRFTERQMLQLLLIPSGNNIARLLARWDSGTQEAFVTKMTKAATDLGMTNTTYTGASGFESTTKSTAVDQLKLAREVMKNDVFRSVVAQPNIKVPGVGTIYNNNNDLVHVGVIGIKTGSSTPAGGALMWAANKKIDGKEQLILGVVLQQHGGTTVYDSLQAALVNSQKLIDSVQGGLTSSTIVKKGEVVGQVDDGLGGHTPVVAGKDLRAVGWAGMKTTLTMTADKDGLPHSAKAGTQVGTLGFGSGSARTTVPVLLRSDLSEPSFAKKLTRVS